MSRRPNIEALRLYRDILRRSRSFYWPNDKGEPWNKVLQESARKEFEQARHETDPLIVARLLVVGRDALMQLEDKVSFLFTGHVVLPALMPPLPLRLPTTACVQWPSFTALSLTPWSWAWRRTLKTPGAETRPKGDRTKCADKSNRVK